MLANRGQYVAACLTIARAYIAASRPRRLPRLPSYERWSDTVRSSLVWLGREDPVNTMGAGRIHDPIRQTRADVFSAWGNELTLDHAYRTADLIQKAEEWNSFTNALVRPELNAALLAVAGVRTGVKIDPRRLGRWLARNENSIAGGYKLIIDHTDPARPYARLVLLK